MPIEKKKPENILFSLCKTESFTKITQEDTTKPSEYEFVLTANNPERDGRTYVMSGISIDNFNNNPIALWNHNPDYPIGTWKNLKKTGDKISGTLKLASSGICPVVDKVTKLIEDGVLKAVSIGTHPTDYEIIHDEKTDLGFLKINKADLLECSVVAVGNHLEALKASQFSDQLLEQAKEEKPKEVKPTLKSTVISAVTTKKPGDKKMPLSDRIKEQQNQLQNIQVELEKLESSVEKEDFTTEQSELLDTLIAQKEHLESQINRNLILEKNLAKEVKPVSNNAYNVQNGQEIKTPEKLLSRLGAVSLLSYAQKKDTNQIISEQYKTDRELNAVHSSAMGTADTTTTGWAAELVQEGIQGYIDLLKPVSVYAALASQGMHFDFGGNGSLKIPGRDSTNKVNGAFVGETGAIPVKRIGTNSKTLNRYKMGVISTFSKEITEYSTPQIEAIVQQAMLDDTAASLDGALLDASAEVQGVRPASILNGVTGTASAGVTAAQIAEDLKKLREPMLNANAGAKPVIIMNPGHLLGLQTVLTGLSTFVFRDEVATGFIMGNRIITSTNVPKGTVICMDNADFVTALGMPIFNTSEEATLVMADADTSAPTHAADAAGTIGTADQVPADGGIPVAGGSGAAVAGAVAMSLFQTNSLALKMTMPLTWSMLRGNTIATCTSVAW